MAIIAKDGLDALRGLFQNDDAFVEHIIQNTLFFEKKHVTDQARAIRKQISAGERISSRFTSNKNYIIRHDVKTTTPNFKNKKEAIKFANYDNLENKLLLHKDTKIRVKIDADGNYAPKCAIKNCTQQLVSCGQRSTIINYTISHIWAKTDNPLFFNSLWNYVLIPTYCAFITDKRDDSDPLVARVKELIKAISWELYDPNHIMDWNQAVLDEEDKPSSKMRTEARRLKTEKKIQYVPFNNSVEAAAAVLEEPMEIEETEETAIEE